MLKKMHFDLKKVHFFYSCKLLYYYYNNGRPTGIVTDKG